MISLGPNLLDLSGGVVLTPDGPQALSEKERLLLQLLARSPGQAVPKATLEQALWPEGLPAGSRALDLLFSRLRARVEPPRSRGVYLQSIRGQGLALTPAPPEQHPAHRRGQLVGRARELTAALAWARDLAGGQWLTVTGLGGIGKTRIAQAVADTLSDEGALVRWLDLSPYRDGDAPLLALANTFGLQLRAVDELERALRYLREPALLIADNLEHVPQAATRLAALLPRAPKLRVLATSRRVVHGREDPVLHLEGIGGEAAAFFRDSVAAVAPGQLGALDEEVVDQICSALHGMPLSIELAVATLRFQPLARLLATLNERPHALKGEARGRPERQASLSATFTYSWAMLEPGDQLALATLSLMAGRFGRPEAEAMGVAETSVRALAAYSLLREGTAPNGSATSPPDLSLHPLVRSFADEQRRQLDPAGGLEQRYRRWILGWAGARVDEIATDADLGLAGAWTRYLPDLDAAWNQALLADDGEALAAGWAGISAWLEAGHPFPESTAWRESALQALAERPHRRDLYLRILAVHVLRAGDAGTVAKLEPLLEAGLNDATAPRTRVDLLRAAGRQACRRAAAEAGARALDQALAEALPLGDPKLVGLVYLDRNLRYRDLGRSDLGWEDAEAAVVAFRQVGHHPLLRQALFRKLSVLSTRQDPAYKELFDQLVPLARLAADEPLQRDLQEFEVRILRKDGRAEEALPLARELEAHFNRTGQAIFAWRTLHFLGTLLLDLGRWTEAEATLQDAEEKGRLLGVPWTVCNALHALSTAQLAAGRRQEALATLDALEVEVQQHFATDHFWQALRGGNHAYARWLSGDLAGARAGADWALARCADLPPSMRFAISLIDGILLAESGAPAAAAAAALRALDIAAPGGPWMVQRALIHVATILALSGEAPTAAALLPQLRAAPSTPEKWIYLPQLESRLAEVAPTGPALTEQPEVLSLLRQTLERLAAGSPR